uniref:Salivary lipocalin n=1 Tax=Triatoma infestans TaxID=30076 RepID=A6YPL6_TRIIF|nr:salivary lipocalin [Triatoma infestans]
MEMIIVVTFVGILTCAYGDYDCSIERATSDFEPERFFMGKWYLVRGTDEAAPTVCQTFRNNETEGDTLFAESGNNKFQSKGITGKFKCEGGKKDEGQYSFKCISEECGIENTNFDADFKILMVHYEDFAVVCRSITFANGEKDDDIFQLERTVDDLIPKDIC